MNRDLRIALERVVAKCDLPKAIKGEDWLEMFYDIHRLVAKNEPSWYCKIECTWAMRNDKERYYEITFGRWSARLNRYSTWETIQVIDERFKDEVLRVAQRKEAKRKIRKIIIRMDDGKR